MPSWIVCSTGRARRKPPAAAANAAGSSVRIHGMGSMLPRGPAAGTLFCGRGQLRGLAAPGGRTGRGTGRGTAGGTGQPARLAPAVSRLGRGRPVRLPLSPIPAPGGVGERARMAVKREYQKRGSAAGEQQREGRMLRGFKNFLMQGDLIV